MTSETWPKRRSDRGLAGWVRRRHRLVPSVMAMAAAGGYVLMMRVAFGPEVLRFPAASDALPAAVPLVAAILFGAWLLAGGRPEGSDGDGGPSGPDRIGERRR